MKEVFLYNKGRHTLHIKGYCHYTKGKTDYIQFNSENEALAYDGRSVTLPEEKRKNVKEKEK